MGFARSLIANRSWCFARSLILKDIAQDGHGMNKVKIQKILFFAQEEHLYQYDEPLFEDIIVAWKHGPEMMKYPIYTKK